jgi:aspartyl-tRNA(Asn)/glutamyl-tRNA(Gln) amidotransferase subunit A
MKLPSDIKSQKKQILDKAYSHVDLVNKYLERIEKYDYKINSFITVLKESAFKQAKICDSIISELGDYAYKKYPLLGIVTSIKDLFSVKNVKTTAGSKLLANYYSPYDATVVSKLKKAGIIIVGKTNCDAWRMDHREKILNSELQKSMEL